MRSPMFNPQVHTHQNAKVDMGFGCICIVQWPNNGTFSQMEEETIFAIATKAFMSQDKVVSDHWTITPGDIYSPTNNIKN